MDSTGLLAALLSGSRSADIASLIIIILLATDRWDVSGAGTKAASRQNAAGHLFFWVAGINNVFTLSILRLL